MKSIKDLISESQISESTMDFTVDSLDQYLDSKMFNDVSDHVDDWNEEEVLDFLISEDDWCFAKRTLGIDTEYYIAVGCPWLYRFTFGKNGSVTGAESWFYDEVTGYRKADSTNLKKAITSFYGMSK